MLTLPEPTSATCTSELPSACLRQNKQALADYFLQVVFFKYDRDQRSWTNEGELGGAGTIASLGASGVNDDEDDRFWLNKSSYNMPSSLHLADAALGPSQQPELLKSLPAMFDARCARSRLGGGGQ